ncbi:MAG: LCP family protein [Firmicutes bacterium]|nr:LCP family protein [Bacillota bacterium]
MRNEQGLAMKLLKIVISVLLIAATAALVFQIYHLNILPTNLLIPIDLLIVLFVIVLLFALNFSVRRAFSSVLMLIITTCIALSFGLGSMYLMYTFDTLSDVSGKTGGNVRNNICVVTLANSSYEELSDLEGKKVGTLNKLDEVSTKGIKKDIKKKEINLSYKKYDAVQAEVDALYEGEVEAIILNRVYFDSVAEIEGYETFNTDIKTLYTYSYYSKEANEPLVVSDVTTNPFTILISGNDSYGKVEDVARSDVNLLVTVNPVTSTVLMTSLPRDMYVPMVCEDGACPVGAYDKLTHTGMYGTDTTIQTIQQMLNIDINYTFRVNFSSAIDIVDTLGGIDVFIEEGFEVEHFFVDGSDGVKAGWNHLDGKRALAFCRERKAYLDGDFQRARNQQQALQAIIKKAISSDMLMNYTDLLKIMKGAFETNMSMDEITSLLRFELQTMPDWKFENYVIMGEPDVMACASMGNLGASVIVPDEYSVGIAHDKIEAVLNGESSETVVDESGIEAAGSNPDYDYNAAVIEELIAQGYSDYEIELYFQGLLDMGDQTDTYHEEGIPSE